MIQLSLFPRRGYALQLMLDGSLAADATGVYIAPTLAEAEGALEGLPSYLRGVTQIRRVAWHDDPATLVIED